MLEKKPLGFLISLIRALGGGAIGRFRGDDFGELALLLLWLSFNLLVVDVVLMVVTGTEGEEGTKEVPRDRGGRRSWEREKEGAESL